MSPIAEWMRTRMLAATEKYSFACLRSIFHWCHTGVFMATIAKRLLATFATSAPEVGFAFFNFDRIWRFLCYNGRCHVRCLTSLRVAK